jgi:hypothetical protein
VAAALFRHLGAGGNYVYLTSEEIIDAHAEDCRKYYLEVKLPEGTGTFLSDGFEKTVANLVKIWQGLFGGLSGAGLHVSQLVKNWDLDTGGDSDVDGVMTFWA